ncbi:malto-oligosyltrehalose synthase [Dyella sedimenti]|uniref:malto-oligosyltrehalose synthase n=1 Tax=Dyella sedimenti TaxID=2919947 RepID=UPI001FA9BCAE|nr:malto-oligosyltrehalose synthase [Dyella sedimenti]
MPELLATVRIQLHPGFDFWAALRQVPYYRRLGISHLYLSPIAEARVGSTHGYDVTDPTMVRKELGGETGLRALAEALHEHGMGAILDIVPNHMAADPANPWWRDVLLRGPDSRYARYFDIDWASPASPGRLWLPWLPAPLDEVIAHGGLRVECDDARAPVLCHADWRLPLAEGSLDALNAATADGMRALLERQHYRLAWWRSSSDVVNYRRFFDIDGLAALDMACEEAFDAVHALPLRLLATGMVDGLRIDHIDGLADPTRYLVHLRNAIAPIARRRSAPVSLHVEKILRGDERLPDAWPVDGSTGYDMMDRLSAILHDGQAQAPLARTWRELGGRRASFAREERLARRQWLRRGLRSDFERTVRAWQGCLREVPTCGDYTDAALARACADVLVHMPVYRTYLGAQAPGKEDRRVLSHAFARAERDGHPDDRELRQWLHHAMSMEPPERDAHCPWRQARQRFEQLSAPLAAKAVEDTAFYRHGAWLSRNEVGSDPSVFALDAEAFHRDMQWRAAHAPRSLVATATHDHKRGEDVRARMAAWSERPERWQELLSTSLPVLRDACGERVAAGDIAMLLQTLVAAWPLALDADDATGLHRYLERMRAWWIKALREARLHTRWTRPDEAYEEAAMTLLQRLEGDAGLAPTLQRIADAAHGLDAPGALNGLVSLALRHTLPGIPDLYQGDEDWDLSLVDPDNRRPVDYPARHRRLASSTPLPELLRQFRDGAIKQALLARLLAARHALPGAFLHGDYQAWPAHGPAADHVLAFLRHHGRDTLLVAVPRLCMRWMDGQPLPRVPLHAWRDTRLLPPAAAHYRDLLGERALRAPDAEGWPLSELLGEWPVAVCHASTEEP